MQMLPIIQEQLQPGAGSGKPASPVGTGKAFARFLERQSLSPGKEVLASLLAGGGLVPSVPVEQPLVGEAPLTGEAPETAESVEGADPDTVLAAAAVAAEAMVADTTKGVAPFPGRGTMEGVVPSRSAGPAPAVTEMLSAAGEGEIPVRLEGPDAPAVVAVQRPAGTGAPEGSVAPPQPGMVPPPAVAVKGEAISPEGPSELPPFAEGAMAQGAPAPPAGNLKASAGTAAHSPEGEAGLRAPVREETGSSQTVPQAAGQQEIPDRTPFPAVEKGERTDGAAVSAEPMPEAGEVAEPAPPGGEKKEQQTPSTLTDSLFSRILGTGEPSRRTPSKGAVPEGGGLPGLERGGMSAAAETFSTEAGRQDGGGDGLLRHTRGAELPPRDPASGGTATAVPFEGALSSAKAPSPITVEGAQTAPSPATVAEGRVVDQVIERISVDRARESSTLTMRLHPEELGQVKLDLTMEKDGLRAHFQAQSQQVQEVLERHLPRLREALQHQGLNLEEVRVSVDSGGSEGRGFSQEQRQPWSQTGFASRRPDQWQGGDLQGGETPLRQHFSGQSGLSLRI